MTLSLIRFISSKPESQADYSDLLYLIKELCTHFERNKKTILRISIILSLERVVQPIDLTKMLAREQYQVAIMNELYDLRKKAMKWAKDDDLKPSCFRLSGVILLNSPLDYFSQNIDQFILDLLPKSKVKPFVYDCVLQLLRGRYYVESLHNSRNRVFGSFSISESYRSDCISRPANEESQEVIDYRVQELAARIFIKRKNAIGFEHIEKCVEIVVQMAVHRFVVSQLKFETDPALHLPFA